jgi:hypothetical protein
MEPAKFLRLLPHKGFKVGCKKAVEQNIGNLFHGHATGTLWEAHDNKGGMRQAFPR